MKKLLSLSVLFLISACQGTILSDDSTSREESQPVYYQDEQPQYYSEPQPQYYTEQPQYVERGGQRYVGRGYRDARPQEYQRQRRSEVRETSYVEDPYYYDDGGRREYESRPIYVKQPRQVMRERRPAPVSAPQARVLRKSPSSITYEYYDTSVDDVAEVAGDYCYKYGKQAYLRAADVSPEYRRQATFDCLAY